MARLNKRNRSGKIQRSRRRRASNRKRRSIKTKTFGSKTDKLLNLLDLNSEKEEKEIKKYLDKNKIQKEYLLKYLKTFTLMDISFISLWLSNYVSINYKQDDKFLTLGGMNFKIVNNGDKALLGDDKDLLGVLYNGINEFISKYRFLTVVIAVIEILFSYVFSRIRNLSEEGIHKMKIGYKVDKIMFNVVSILVLLRSLPFYFKIFKKVLYNSSSNESEPYVDLDKINFAKSTMSASLPISENNDNSNYKKLPKEVSKEIKEFAFQSHLDML